MKFVSDPKHKEYFFPPSIQAIFSDFKNTLQGDNKALLFTDAYHKSKGLPNGIALVSSEKDTQLYPAILRDPGCGFSLFQLTLNPEKSVDALNKSLLEWESRYKENYVDSPLFTDLREYCFGEKDWRKPNHLQQCAGPMPVAEESVYLNQHEVDALMLDVTQITNTLEIKKFHKNAIANVDSSGLIGVLHCGSDFLPNLLEDKFYPLINQKNPGDPYRRGVESVPLHSDIGQYYYQWLVFAMNYCLAKRYLMIQSLAEYLAAENIATVSLLHDKIHAGIWKDPFNEHQWIQTRGVQSQSILPQFPYTYIAGHRETISALVSPGSRSVKIHNLLCHGTGLQTGTPEDHSLSNLFNNNDINALAMHCHFNTQPEYHLTCAYTQNLLATLSHYQEEKYIADFFLLEPLINIQSKNYVKNTAYLREK